ncbi:EKC/KEOPS complex subunit TPRKB-like [Euwallacea fornicatus]|uniref:EKC/KEOPS complex subunit TPRKB-like n=1 Tax=Euwallacea fornicatus TaxID=995702 RepID=UPI00338FDBD0
MNMAYYAVELDPSTGKTLKMQLYENVKNTMDLRKQIMNGELQCTIIKPELICDPFQVVIAANKTLTSKKQTTKSVFTEILYNLSPSSNISQSLSKFGVDDKSKGLLVVTLENNDDKSDAEISNNIFALVKGDVLDISELGCTSDIRAIRKIYKISDVEYHSVDLLDSIVSRIAIKE